MIKKIIFISLTVLLFSSSHSQTNLKVNGLTAFVLIPNIAIETTLKNHWTFQADVSASFWKSINGGPLQFIILTPELRYHINSNNQGFYFGGHIAGGKFKLQKWSYTETQYYQKGYNYMMGVTIGYQKKISTNFLIDIFAGGGNQQAFYKGYSFYTGERVEKAHDYNKSGEWLPYRGGIMICYQFK